MAHCENTDKPKPTDPFGTFSTKRPTQDAPLEFKFILDLSYNCIALQTNVENVDANYQPHYKLH